ncbi:MAG: hypothetical protein M1817_004066 [Caeruleum heppii]|nr:MAG: hypothetical protein M1817_004066 [Caeruleum heppii]
MSSSPPSEREARESGIVPALPITPPCSEDDPDSQSVLDTAVHVLATEATALSYLARLYQTDPVSRLGFVNAVEQVVRSAGGGHGAAGGIGGGGGKLIVCGVGKSGKIGEKLVATMNSLGIFTVFLHPTEALHGDLGIIRPTDTLLLITFSGRTPELAQLMRHLPPLLPIILLTSHSTMSPSPLIQGRPNAIVLPTPIHESEDESFEVSAPTTSTTVALALGDALAVACARKLYPGKRAVGDVFRGYHPGGSIGTGGV